MVNHRFLVAANFINVSTVQRDLLVAPSFGDTIYNTTSKSLEVFGQAGLWIPLDPTINNGLSAYMTGFVPANAILAMQIMSEETTFEAGNTKSKAYAMGTANTATVLTIYRKALASTNVLSTIGTITFGAGLNVGVVNFNIEAVLAVGDQLYVETPADLFQLKDLFFHLKGFSRMPIYS